MEYYYICKGDKTTHGGTVLEGDESIVVAGCFVLVAAPKFAAASGGIMMYGYANQ